MSEIMKKIISIVAFVILCLNANAIPLFPFFTDLAGDYRDGPVEELAAIGVECMCSNKSHWYNTIEAADEFLNEVLPFSSYPIEKKVVEIKGIKAEMYASPMVDNRTSVLYLMEIPEKGLYVFYDELDVDLLNVEQRGYFD